MKEPEMKILSVRERIKFDNIFYERVNYLDAKYQNNNKNTIIWYYETDAFNLAWVSDEKLVEKLNNIYDRTKTNNQKI